MHHHYRKGSQITIDVAIRLSQAWRDIKRQEHAKIMDIMTNCNDMRVIDTMINLSERQPCVSPRKAGAQSTSYTHVSNAAHFHGPLFVSKIGRYQRQAQLSQLYEALPWR
jgi:hypothetical protein